MKCPVSGCYGEVIKNSDFCVSHTYPEPKIITPIKPSMSEKYPKYYKVVPQNMTEVDVYAVHYMFQVEDYSGCIHHASKKLLLSGVRTGNKSKYKDIEEARDTLTRWLELNKE